MHLGFKTWSVFKVGKLQDITSKNINQQQPQIVRKTFQNQEEKVFEEV